MSHLNETFLKKEIGSQIKISLFDSLSSTNDFLKNQSPELHLCLTEKQTAGRGRFSKTWVSPSHQNIYLSLLWPTQKALCELEGLSLVVAISIAETLSHLGFIEKLKIKWPNDIYWENKKLAGILVELEPAAVIIGVGLNVNMQSASEILKPWTSLKMILNKHFDRNKIIALIIKQLLSSLFDFERSDFSSFLPKWPTWDFLYGKKIKIKVADQTIEGMAQGINKHGYLLLKTNDDKTRAFSSGEIVLT